MNHSGLACLVINKQQCILPTMSYIELFFSLSDFQLAVLWQS